MYFYIYSRLLRKDNPLRSKRDLETDEKEELEEDLKVTILYIDISCHIFYSFLYIFILMNLLHCNDKHVQFEYYFTKALAQKPKLRNYFG